MNIPSFQSFDFKLYEKSTDIETRKELIENVFDKISYYEDEEPSVVYEQLPKKWQDDEALCLFLVKKDFLIYKIFSRKAKSNVKIAIEAFKTAQMSGVRHIADFVPFKVKNNFNFVKDVVKDNVFFLSYLDKRWLNDKNIQDIALEKSSSGLLIQFEKENFTLDFMIRAFRICPRELSHVPDGMVDDEVANAFKVEIENQGHQFWIDCFKNLNQEWIREELTIADFEEDFDLFDVIVDHLNKEDIENNFVDVFPKIEHFSVVREKVKDTILKKQVASVEHFNKENETQKTKRKMKRP